MILIRIYGKNTEVLIDRQKEIANFKSLHKYGFAPKLLATFNNGLAYEYTNGKPLSKTDIYEEEVWRRIAQRMAEMHRDIQCQPDGDESKATVQPVLWTKIYKMFDLIPAKYSDAARQQRFVTIFHCIMKKMLFSILQLFFFSFCIFSKKERTTSTNAR